MGAFVSAETMMAPHTLPSLPEINRLLARLGARRHEIHPMYASGFAAGLRRLGLDELRAGITRFLNERDRNLWALFGTLPFFACSDDPADLVLIDRLRREPNVTVRNDPDGRCRLNVNLLTGDVRVSDFAALPPVGNVLRESLPQAFAAWREAPLCQRYDCTCLEANCTGPCLLVVDTYYRDWDFRARKAQRSVQAPGARPASPKESTSRPITG